MQIQENISLKKYNTFGIDVKARYFIELKNEEQIEEIFSSEVNSEKRFILGGGSNVLFTKNYEGLILKNSISGINKLTEDSNEVIIEAGAGVIWQDLVNYCVKNKYWGIENLSLIPGTVGAAPIQNIGAYGQELKNIFLNLNGFDLLEKVKRNYNNEDCQFGYRDSIFKNSLKGFFLITSVQLKLSKRANPILSYQPVMDEIDKRNINNSTIAQISDMICDIRKSKLPDPNEIGNAGSFFKNPEISENTFEHLKKEFKDINSYKTESGVVKISAGWLIEKCGWKGKRKGDVASFEKQALILVNYGNATGKEVLDFAEEVKKTVKEKFGILLIEEINII
ncbi:MAG: UDP-N-acetylmuramate dehydrogenase [Bacteroidetes bacterium]|nr:UDP-N-acetylmuramate dehydrogenase [Bacteroidota bacterium]